MHSPFLLLHQQEGIIETDTNPGARLLFPSTCIIICIYQFLTVIYMFHYIYISIVAVAVRFQWLK